MKIASHPRNPSTQQQFGIWPKVAPGTNFSPRRPATSIRPNAPTGTQRPQAESKKPAIGGPSSQVSTKLRMARLGWRTQSISNLSQHPNSLLTGKLTGNFVEFLRAARFESPTREQIQSLAAKFPTQQNRELLRRNREFCQGTGNLHAANREFQPPSHDHPPTEVFDRRYYQPCPPPTAACHRHRPEPHHRAGARQGGPVRFFADIFGLPVDAPSYHFAPMSG
jgi:hypothetical protein